MNNKKYYFIDDRINIISELLDESTSIDSIIDYKNMDESLENYYKSEDIRELMPKKFIDFNKAIKNLGGKLLYIKRIRNE